ncbi:MAG: hypothetical protein D6708_07010 [Candidatus Dadabacteria bacterium]|nr:MAG: hypothetical protein D6708_07010 [Candidatus Dadabacteria bacterium]
MFAVRIEPLGLQGEERAAAAEREIRAPSGAAGTPVAEVVYDGEMFGGPYLLVVFRRPAVARVRPANDARGLVIAVTEPTGEPEAGRHGGR